MRERLHAVLDLARNRTGTSRRMALVTWGTVLGLITLAVGLTLHPASLAVAQMFPPRPWYESPVTVGPTVLTARGDRPTSLALVVENQTDSVTMSTPTLGFMRTDTDVAGNLVTDIAPSLSRDDTPSAVAWIQGLPDTVVLQPHQRRLVAFTVTPPAHLAPGVYYATIDIPQANLKRVTWKDVKDWGNEWVLAGDKQAFPTALVIIRHGVSETAVQMDSAELVGSRACFRMWTDEGVPYIGVLQVDLHTPPIQETESQSYWAPLASQERPIALYGVSSPKRFCTPLTALPQALFKWTGLRPRVSPPRFSGAAVLATRIHTVWAPVYDGNIRRARVPGERGPPIMPEVSVYVERGALRVSR